MDGTMLDTERLSMESWFKAVQETGLPIKKEIFDETFITKMMGTNLANCIGVIQTLLGQNIDAEQAYTRQLFHMDTYLNKHGVPIKPGLLPLLDKLEKLNIKKCVATSTQKERATQKLNYANIAHRFEIIVGGDEVTRSKPDPEIFLKAAAYCKITPEDCLVLEDSALGTEGAYRANMRVINIPDILQPSESVRNMAFAICKDLFQVAEMM